MMICKTSSKFASFTDIVTGMFFSTSLSMMRFRPAILDMEYKTLYKFAFSALKVMLSPSNTDIFSYADGKIIGGILFFFFSLYCLKSFKAFVADLLFFIFFVDGIGVFSTHPLKNSNNIRLNETDEPIVNLYLFLVIHCQILFL